LTYLLVFLSSGAVVVLAGTALARLADTIAEATGLGRIWIGSILLAAATSLPELLTDVAAVRIGAPDLAVGDLFGSSMANMLILALVDLAYPRKGLLRHAALDHALAACLAIALNALAAAFVVVRPDAVTAGVGPASLVLFAVYIAGTRVVYRHTRREPTPTALPIGRSGPSFRRALLGFAGASLAILVAAPAFAWSANGIAETTGLGTTFVGTWLVGFSTSLPELVSSLTAVRMGAFDLAVGNLFGSNAFNMAILFPLDLAQPGAAIFAALDPGHAISAFFAVVLMALGLAAIVYRAERRFAMIEPDSLLMVLVYALGIWLLYGRVSGA
jgi:cation:H+ antiporter